MLSQEVLIDRFAGAVMGAAIGDALGHPTEFSDRPTITRRYGASGVTGFELWWQRDGGPVAPYTDDTQLAWIVLDALTRSCAAGDFDGMMPAIADGIADWATNPRGGHRAPGNACLAGARRIAEGVPWREAGAPNAGGCGSVMRAYPFGLFFGEDMAHTRDLAAEHSRMTHGDPIALAACAAMACAVGSRLHGRGDDFTWRWMIDGAARYDARTAEMILEAREAGLRHDDPVPVLDKLQGWAAHEAIAAAAFCVSYFPDDFRGAVLMGANAPGDSDSIATLAGALLGAQFGLGAIPPEWVRDVEDSAELLGLAASAAAARTRYPAWGL